MTSFLPSEGQVWLRVDPFSDVHLDPARDPPERYQALFELLGEFWGRLEMVRASSGEDTILEQLVQHVQGQLIAYTLVLSVRMNMIEASERE